MSAVSSDATSPDARTVAVLGEVLFDRFEDGTQILGGAPFNVAWNLQGLGLKPLFVSAIGDDDAGQSILDCMQKWGLSDSGIQTKQNLPTGHVNVTIKQNEPAYDIPLDQAFDHLAFDQFDSQSLLAQTTLVYQGTLFFRTEPNRKFFEKLIESIDAARFVDLNIRQPWFDTSWVNLLVRGAAWVKLNVHELELLAECDVEAADADSVVAGVKAFRTRMELLSKSQTYLVTCGEKGAYWIDDEICLFESSASIESFVDSVGAGDAFSAAVINGIVHLDQPETILHDAVHFAAAACGIQGATSRDPRHYLRH